MSENEVNEAYKKLLIEYEKKGFTNPEAHLESIIWVLVSKGKTREEAILEIWERENPRIPAQRQIDQSREKIKRLAVLYSKGEISEESYKDSVKAIEEDIKGLGRGVGEYHAPPIHVCIQCKKEFTGTRCPYCNTEAPSVGPPSVSSPSISSNYYPAYTKHSPTGLWYFVPFFFGILGGIVAYVGVKSDDQEMANSLLTFGIIWSIILFIIGYVLIFH